MVQFVKGGKWKTGERKLADHLGIEWHTLGDGFTWESTDLDETADQGRDAWAVAAAKLASGDYDLLILDEVTYIVKYGWVDPSTRWSPASATGAPGTNVVAPAGTRPTSSWPSPTPSPRCARSSTRTTQGIRRMKGIEY